MLTIRPILINGNVYTIWVATVAAELVPSLPFGRHAITTLCLPIDPRVYVFVSFDGFGRSACLSSSIAVAAVCSFGRAQTHPIV
jgi:hypothetical protein